MIDESKLAKLKAPEPRALNLEDQLKAMPEQQLQQLLRLVESLLPQPGPRAVKELNLESELMEQYEKTKRLMDTCLLDTEVAVNQKAQVANTLVATLGQLVKLQDDLRLQQTLNLMESTLIDVIKSQPDPFKEEFFEEYELKARKAGLME